MDSKKIRLLLAAIVLMHLTLAYLFASQTPFRQAGILLSQARDPETGLHPKIGDVGAPDERQHVNYIRRLANHQGLPVFNPKDPNLYENYQSHQPPVFYSIGAVWASILDAPAEDTFGRSVRYLNILFGGCTVIAVFFLGKFSFDERTGLLASCWVAVLPMFCALSGAVSNDPLLFLLCTIELALVAYGLRHGCTLHTTVAMALVLGLALWTKTTSVALLPAMVVAIAAARKKSDAKYLLIATLSGLVMILPWWLRNQNLYGDPLALKAFDDAFVGTAQAASFVQGYGLFGYLVNWVGWWTARSFFGIFGYMDIAMNEKGLPGANCPNTLYRLLLVGTIVAILGYFLAPQSKIKSDVVQWVNLTFGFVILALFLKFNMHYFQAQARYLYPAIGPIAVAFSAGLLHLTKGRFKVAAAITVLIFGSVTIYAGTSLSDAFRQRTDLVR